MSNDLRIDTYKAFFWSFLERFGNQGLQFVFSVIMARLLLPEEFGLIAMLNIFIAFAQAFINSGFGQALIQKKDANHVDESSIFYFNIFVAALTTIATIIAAPWISEFYNQPQLELIMKVLSVSLIFNACGLIQRTLLTKNLDFKTQLKVSILTTLISGSVSITLAMKGFGVWSLVVLYLCNEFFNTIILWYLSSWRPSLIFSFESLKSMFAFGSRLLIVSLLNSIFENIYQLVIGKYFTASALGFYARADSLKKYPVTILNNVVSQVTFPVFSKMQDEKERLKRALRKSLQMVVLVVFPLMTGLVITAEPVVVLLLTSKWLPSVPYLQLLCIAGALIPMQAINLNALNAQGRSDLFFRIILLNKLLILIFVVITYRYGIMAMIYGQIVSMFFSYYLNAYYSGKLLDYNFIEQMKDLIPSLFLSGVMGLIIFSFSFFPFESYITLLSLQVVAGIMIYAGLNYLFKTSGFLELINIAKIFKSKQIQ